MILEHVEVVILVAHLVHLPFVDVVGIGPYVDGKVQVSNVNAAGGVVPLFQYGKGILVRHGIDGDQQIPEGEDGGMVGDPLVEQVVVVLDEEAGRESSGGLVS